MNRCKEQKEGQLRDYFLNRLTPEKIEEFQFHLLQCEACRKQLERMRHLATDLDEANLFSETNASFSNPFFRLFTRVGMVAGLALLLIGGGYYFLSVSPETDLPIEMNEAPMFYSADSVAVDSTDVDSIRTQSVKIRVLDEK